MSGGGVPRRACARSSRSTRRRRDDTETWRRTLHEHGLLAVAWPREYGGGGLTKREQVVLAEEFARAGVPTGAPQDNFGIKMVGNTLLRWGTEEQRRRFLPRILSGADRWCQGYSEPDAGSDLAALSTRAVRDGDEWVIDGQKIWTSLAADATWIFLLARTDPDARGHRGISFLLCPMDQPGIEVRPIEMLNHEREFCEVYFTGARTPVENVVGEVGAGWTVAMTLLSHERGEEAATNPILFRAEFDRLVALAREYGRDRDPVVRDRLAWCFTKVETMRYLGERILTQYLRDGELGPAASISKLYWSEYHQRVSELAMQIMGADGLVPTGRRPVAQRAHRCARRAELDRVVDQRVPPQRAARARCTRGAPRSSATSSARPCSGSPRSRARSRPGDGEPFEEALPELHAGLGEVVHVRHPGHHDDGDVGRTGISRGLGVRIGRHVELAEREEERRTDPIGEGTGRTRASCRRSRRCGE